MTFNSLGYLLFLPVVFALFLLTAHRFRWLVLLLAGLVFYASWKVPHLPLVLLLAGAATYGVALALEKAGGRRRHFWLLFGLGANLLVLLPLKYLPVLFPGGTSAEPFLVALGVSYFTFQAISYLLDVHLEVIGAERHFGYFLLYLSFFPKLLQGPIERGGDLLSQLRRPYRFDPEGVREGLLLFGWGLFKKVVVADRLALFVNVAYGDPEAFGGPTLILATWFYALQLYCDFSGYTDMALGTARLFGIRLSRNFDNPYLATSISDFWRRWHITLSRWLLDYLFKPLQMQLRHWRNYGTAAALLVTFFVSGLWHGVGWSFLVWGLLHGVYLAASVFYRPWQKKLHRRLGLEKTRLLLLWQRLATFHLVCFAWIFFRAENLDHALEIIRRLPEGVVGFVWNLVTRLHRIGAGEGMLEPLLMRQSEADFVLALAGIAVVLLVEWRPGRGGETLPLIGRSRPLRWASYYALFFSIVLFGVFTAGSGFIYFRF